MGSTGHVFSTMNAEFFDMSEIVMDVCQETKSEENYNNCAQFNLEHKPNQGTGCCFSYNEGAGAGTADCCDEPKLFDGTPMRNNTAPCPPIKEKEFDPEKLIFGHNMGPDHYKKLNIKIGSDHGCCENIYENKVLGSRSDAAPAKSGCPCAYGYESELANKKPTVCDWEDECCGSCNYLARKN